MKKKKSETIFCFNRIVLCTVIVTKEGLYLINKSIFLREKIKFLRDEIESLKKDLKV